MTCIWKIFHILHKGASIPLCVLFYVSKAVINLWSSFHTLDNEMASHQSEKHCDHVIRFTIEYSVHMLHWFCLSCACNVMWLIRLDLYLYTLPQWQQRCGLSFGHAARCCFKLYLQLKLFPNVMQLWGHFLCVPLWMQRYDLCLRPGHKLNNTPCPCHRSKSLVTVKSWHGISAGHTDD
jgi:hypothetical protein